MKEATLRVFRGETAGGKTVDYRVPLAPGMVVLDALHYIQGHLAPDLAVRWNCKAGKCGSCSAEVNGRPRLTCKTRMDSLPPDKPVTILPMKSFPIIKDLVTDVSWNFRINKKIPPLRRGRARNGKSTREMWTAYGSSASASSVFSARTSATFCASTTRSKSSQGRAFLCAWRVWRCTPWTVHRAVRCSARNWASG